MITLERWKLEWPYSVWMEEHPFNGNILESPRKLVREIVYNYYQQKYLSDRNYDGKIKEFN